MGDRYCNECGLMHRSGQCEGPVAGPSSTNLYQPFQNYSQPQEQCPEHQETLTSWNSESSLGILEGSLDCEGFLDSSQQQTSARNTYQYTQPRDDSFGVLDVSDNLGDFGQECPEHEVNAFIQQAQQRDMNTTPQRHDLIDFRSSTPKWSHPRRVASLGRDLEGPPMSPMPTGLPPPLLPAPGCPQRAAPARQPRSSPPRPPPVPQYSPPLPAVHSFRMPPPPTPPEWAEDHSFGYEPAYKLQNWLNKKHPAKPPRAWEEISPTLRSPRNIEDVYGDIGTGFCRTPQPVSPPPHLITPPLDPDTMKPYNYGSRPYDRFKKWWIHDPELQPDPDREKIAWAEASRIPLELREEKPKLSTLEEVLRRAKAKKEQEENSRYLPKPRMPVFSKRFMVQQQSPLDSPVARPRTQRPCFPQPGPSWRSDSPVPERQSTPAPLPQRPRSPQPGPSSRANCPVPARPSTPAPLPQRAATRSESQFTAATRPCPDRGTQSTTYTAQARMPTSAQSMHSGTPLRGIRKIPGQTPTPSGTPRSIRFSDENAIKLIPPRGHQWVPAAAPMPWGQAAAPSPVWPPTGQNCVGPQATSTPVLQTAQPTPWVGSAAPSPVCHPLAPQATSTPMYSGQRRPLNLTSAEPSPICPPAGQSAAPSPACHPQAPQATSTPMYSGQRRPLNMTSGEPSPICPPAGQSASRSTQSSSSRSSPSAATEPSGTPSPPPQGRRKGRTPIITVPTEEEMKEKDYCRYGMSIVGRQVPRTASTYRPPPPQDYTRPKPKYKDWSPIEGMHGPWLPDMYGSCRPPPRTAAGRLPAPVQAAPPPRSQARLRLEARQRAQPRRVTQLTSRPPTRKSRTPDKPPDPTRSDDRCSPLVYTPDRAMVLESRVNDIDMRIRNIEIETMSNLSEGFPDAEEFERTMEKMKCGVLRLKELVQKRKGQD